MKGPKLARVTTFDEKSLLPHQEAFFAAIKAGNVELVKEQVEESGTAIAGWHDQKGWNALMRTCRRGNLEIFKVLFPLFLSNVDEVILKEGPFINDHILIFACRAGSAAISKVILETSPKLLNQRGSSGQTALFHAIKAQNLSLVKMLVEDYNADTSIVDEFGASNLVLAGKYGARKNGLAIFKVLYNEKPKCEPNAEDKSYEIIRNWVKLGPSCPLSELIDTKDTQNKIVGSLMFSKAFNEEAIHQPKLKAIYDVKAAEAAKMAEEFINRYLLQYGVERLIPVLQEEVGKQSAMQIIQTLHNTEIPSLDCVQEAVDKLWVGNAAAGHNLLRSSFILPFLHPFKFVADADCFWGTPRGKFLNQTTLLAVQLAVYSVFVIGYRDPILEISMYLFAFSSFLETLRTLRKRGFARFWDDVFNKLDVILTILFFAAGGFRVASFILADDAHRSRAMLYSFTILSYIAIFLWFKILRVCLLSSSLGPLITTISSMIADMMNFGFLLVVIMFGFAITYTSLSRLHSDEYQSTFFKTTGNLFQSLLGNFDFEKANEEIPVAGVFLLAIYLILGSILLLNLLIAILSSTYERIRETADAEFKYGYTFTVLQYSEDPAYFPAPLNIVQELLFFLDIGSSAPRISTAITCVIFLILLAPFSILYLIASVCLLLEWKQLSRYLSTFHMDFHLIKRRKTDEDDDVQAAGDDDGQPLLPTSAGGGAHGHGEDEEEDKEDEDLYADLSKATKTANDEEVKKMTFEIWDRVVGQAAQRMAVRRKKKEESQQAGQDQAAAGVNVNLPPEVLQNMRAMESKIELILQALKNSKEFQKYFPGARP